MTEGTKRAGLSASDVARKVAEYLKDCHPGGIDVAVDPDGVQQGEFSWRVRVRPSKEPPKLSQYYEALADVEIELEEREQLNVWLITRDPEHTHSVEGHPPVTQSKSPALPSTHQRKRRPTGTKPAV